MADWRICCRGAAPGCCWSLWRNRVFSQPENTRNRGAHRSRCTAQRRLCSHPAPSGMADSNRSGQRTRVFDRNGALDAQHAIRRADVGRNDSGLRRRITGLRFAGRRFPSSPPRCLRRSGSGSPRRIATLCGTSSTEPLAFTESSIRRQFSRWRFTVNSSIRFRAQQMPRVAGYTSKWIHPHS